MQQNTIMAETKARETALYLNARSVYKCVNSLEGI